MEALLMRTVHRPNRKAWQIGDLVIHDRDAKEHRMVRVVCPRGLVMGGVFACHEDALVASESRNALLRDTYPEIEGNYTSVQALAFFPDSLA